MQQYEILVTSTLGRKGQIVTLPDNMQTKQRLDKGIVRLAEQYQPTEKKSLVKAKQTKKK